MKPLNLPTLLIALTLCHIAYADSNFIQAQLMDIAAKEAQIANIGANKYMMLYGKNNPIEIINHWNEVEHHPALNNEQINQINQLELEKQQLLKGGNSN